MPFRQHSERHEVPLDCNAATASTIRPAIDLPTVTRALSVHQPYAERIMRGTKRVEFRSRPTNIRERAYV